METKKAETTKSRGTMIRANFEHCRHQLTDKDDERNDLAKRVSTPPVVADCECVVRHDLIEKRGSKELLLTIFCLIGCKLIVNGGTP